MKKIPALIAIALAALSLQAVADVGLSSDRYAVSPGNGDVSLAIQRDEASGSVTVGYRTTSASAIDGVDYTGTQLGTVTIPDGQSSANISIPLVYQSNTQTRAFAVELTSITGDQLSGILRADVQILGAADASNKAGVFRLPVESTSVNPTINYYAFTVSRESGAKGPASVQLKSRDNPNIEPINQTLTWGSGEAGVRTVVVRYKNATGASRTTGTTAIIDLLNPTGSTIQGQGFISIGFLGAGDGAAETDGFLNPAPIYGAGTTNISISYLAPCPYTDDAECKKYWDSFSFQISPASANTSAGEGADYTATPSLAGTPNFNGSGTATFDITIERPAKNDRQIDISIFGVGGSLKARSLITILGVDHDPNYSPTADYNDGDFAFFTSEAKFASSAASLLTFVNRTGPYPLLQKTLQYRLTAIDAAIGLDVDAENTVGTISWAENEVGAKQVEIPLKLKGQPTVRTFKLDIFDLSGNQLASQSLIVSGAGTDADSTSIGFTSALKYFPREIESVVTFVQRSGAGDADSSVQYHIEDGSTVPSLDYPADSAIGTVEWAAGQIGYQAIEIPLIERDPCVDKSFTLRLIGSGVAANTASQTIMIEGLAPSFDDTGEIGLSRSTVTTDTKNGSIPVTVNRNGGSDCVATATLHAAYADGSVKQFGLKWPAGSNDAKTVSLPITEAGTIHVSVDNVYNAIDSGTTLEVTVEDAGTRSGGGAMGFAFLFPSLLLGIARRRRGGR